MIVERPRRAGHASRIAGILACFPLILATPGAASSLLVLDANCVDPVAERSWRASLWIDDGRVRAVGAPDGRDLGVFGAMPDTLDLEGATLLPGLVDLRVYGTVQRSPGHRDSLDAAAAASLAASAGVVATLDVFSVGVEDKVAGWWPGGPWISTSRGPAADFPGARIVDRPSMVAALVASLDAELRFVQVVLDRSRPGGIGPDLLGALVEAASARGLEVVAQVTRWPDVQVALDAGVRWLVQIPDGPMPASIATRVGELGSELAWTPQLAVGLDLAALVGDPELREDALLGRVLPDTMRGDYERVRIPQTRFAEVAARRDAVLASVAALAEARVRLRPGSGAGAVATALGFSLSRELQWWGEAGVDVWFALRAATVEAATLLGRRLGFEVGDDADFVILARSPLEDLAALRTVEAVIRAGVVADPEALAASVAHRVVEELPDNPLPWGGRIPMVVILGAGFIVLLLIRRAIRRAAARALADDPGPPTD